MSLLQVSGPAAVELGTTAVVRHPPPVPLQPALVHLEDTVPLLQSLLQLLQMVADS